MRSGPRGISVAWVVAAAGLVGDVLAAELTSAERDGRRIYESGQSPSGARITARIGMGGLELSGAALACANCHGEDGRGRPEGGVVPSNIQWPELTKPYGHDHGGRRDHGAFDERTLRRAVLSGIDPAGHRIDSAMPRYEMSSKDFGFLAAYLKKLDSNVDAGVSDDHIRIATLLPSGGRLADLGAAVRSILQSYFDRLNAAGGIHGRRLELVVEPWSGDASDSGERARALLDKAEAFAILAPLTAGVEMPLSDAARDARIPVIGPLTLFPENRNASNPYVFHLLPGVDELARVLIEHAGLDPALESQPVALWHAGDTAGRSRARELDRVLRDTGRPVPLALPIGERSPDLLAQDIARARAGSVLVLGTGADILGLAQALERIGWTPHLLIPGPLAPRDIVALPSAFRDRVTLAYPSAPQDQQQVALRDLAGLLPERIRADGGRLQQPTLVAAYAAALLLAEGLKRTGRDLTRRRLLATLETVQGFETGLLPRLTYNADRRIGSMGGYLVAVDVDRRSLRPMGGYRQP